MLKVNTFLGDGKDSCRGDSGGPLMRTVELPASSPKYYLFGITCYGLIKCGNSAAIYTNVLYFMNWVLPLIQPLE